MSNEILNCKFAFRCGQTWGALKAVQGVPGVKYCERCESAVHLCRSAEEFEEHASRGHCVALVGLLGRTTVGLAETI